MAPEYPAKLRVMDLRWQNEKLRGTLHYIEAPPQKLLRVRWEVETQPDDYLAVGEGVAYVNKMSDVLILPGNRDAIPDSLGNSRYRMLEGLSGQQRWLMSILVLPKDYTLTDPQPAPASAKEFKGRLALYWVLEGDRLGRTKVEWTLKRLEKDLSLEVERINSSYSSGQVPLAANVDVVTPSPSNLVFISYSHSDSKWLNRLQVHLKPLERQGTIQRWDDTKIQDGTKWREEIKRALQSTRVAVMLVRADFLASDFIAHNELPPLLKAAEDKGTLILPVIISPCMFEETKSLSQFQTVNPPSRPLSSMTKNRQEETLRNVSRDIMNAIHVV